MLVERIERVRDKKGLDTKEAYVTFEGSTEPVLLDFPCLPEGCEVECVQMRGANHEMIDAYLPVMIPGLKPGRMEHERESAGFFYRTKDFITFADILYFCRINEKPLSTYNWYPFELMNIQSLSSSKPIARFADIDRGFIPTTFEMRLEELRYACREVLTMNESEGHTWISYGDFCTKLNRLLTKSNRTLSSGQQPSAVLRHFNNEFYLDDHLSKDAKVARVYIRNLEYSIYNAITACKNMASPYSQFHPVTTGLSVEQERAVTGSMTTKGRVSIVTGGPGTGKTTVLTCIVDTLATQYPGTKVAMLAPTNKATKRIEEVIGDRDICIKTIHKFVGWGSFVTKEMRDEMRSFQVIIVDEFSMADIEIFWELLSAINLEDTKLILVGDADQLPSVGAGNLLRDLIALGIPTFRLTQNFRSCGLIDKNAKRIINGQVFLEEGDEFRIVPCGVGGWMSAAITVAGEKDADIATISPYRKDSIAGSAGNINDMVQKALYSRDTYSRCGKFYRGDHVIFTGSNADAGYVNGECGIIVSYYDGVYTVDVDGATVEVGYEQDIELAYSITIHKSQGSEYDTVIIVLPKASQFVTRRMLYTAVTRAKSQVIVYASKETIRAVIANNTDEERRTFLSYRASTI